LTSALLLAAFVSGAGSQARAYYQPVTLALDLVPSDCDGFVTIRVAELSDKLGLKKTSDLAVFAEYEKSLGLRLNDIDRMTFVACAESPQRVVMVHTTRPYDRARVLKAVAPEAKEVKHRGKVFHVTSDEDAVCLVDDQFIVAGPKKELMQLLFKKTDRETTGPLAEALARAVNHDIVAWGRVAEEKPEAAKPAPPPAVLSASYKYNRAPKKKKSPVMLGTLVAAEGVPMPPGATSADLTLDVGKQLALQVCVNFADEDSAERGVKYVRVGVEMMRGMMAAMTASMAVLELADELGVEDQELPDVPPVVLGLMKKTEKALDGVRVEAHGSTIPVALTIPSDAKTLSSALVAVMNMVGSDNGPHCCAMGVFGCGNHYTAPPAAVGIVPPVCLPPQPVSGPVQPYYAPPMPAQLWGGSAPVMPIQSPYAAPPVMTAPVCPAATASYPVPVAEPLPAPREMPTPQSTCATQISYVPPPAPGPIKLAIGNVSKEAALLFLEGEGGKLTFQKKVPAGEAIDVETTPGQRWVAVFADNPAGQTYMATPDKTTWLLRGASRKETDTPPVRNTYAPEYPSPAR
jgi:hypothetical protein